jgi:hypothetical protein
MIGERFELKEFYSISKAINSDINSNTVFVIANERLKNDGTIGRYFTVFPSFKSFLAIRDAYPHCHELLIDHKNNQSDISGRLVFDFDIKSEYIPSDFKNQVENTIIEVVKTYMIGVNIDKFIYVWSTSKNPKKFSKHLTVKNMYFDNWILLSKIFYKLFCNIWDSKYIWLESKQLIDFQIIKKNGSLRMVGSRKIDGNILNLDNKEHTLEDSLIRIYLKKQQKIEQLITKDNFIESDAIEVTSDIFGASERETAEIVKYSIIAPSYAMDIYQNAFKLYNRIDPGIFEMGKINGTIMSILRIKKRSNKCILSGKKHDSENAYLNIIEQFGMYNVHFGCYRKCGTRKTIRIGSLIKDTLMIIIDPRFNKNRNVEHTSRFNENRSIEHTY